MPGETLGVGAAVIAGAAALAYVRTIFEGRSRPHRVTWGVWSLVGGLGAFSALAGGAGPGAYTAFVFFGLTVVVFGLSLMRRYGKSGGDAWYDWPLGTVAAGTIVLWKAGGLPVAVASTVAWVADGAAAWPTLREAWRQPDQEASLPWLADAFASALAVLAVAHYSYTASAYAAYLAVAQTLIALTVVSRRRASRVETNP
jgi:hypothetical protein